MTMDQIKAEVQQKVMKIEIHGIIAVDFQTAYREYQGLISRLKKINILLLTALLRLKLTRPNFC